jgi:signal transduction histidine kinase
MRHRFEHHHFDLHERWARRWSPRRRRFRRLQTRLFLWFLGAIVLAVCTSVGTLGLLNASDSSMGPGRVAARSIAQNVARTWDDPRATETYLQSVRETVGLDLHVRRDPSTLHPRVRRAAKRGQVAFDHDDAVIIPVTRDGALIGTVEFDTGVKTSHFLQLFLALGAALFVLGMAAKVVARRLAWPLETVAHAAERFGEGDLTTRTRIGETPRRWVAEEVREVARAFDTMAGRIEGVVRDQRELLGAISHELRSPLGRARVALEIARERGHVASTQPFDEIERQLSDVDAILGDLLAAARAGLSDLRTQPTALLEWLRARIAAEPEPPTITLGPAAEADVALEPALMNRALHNVFANARAHGHPPDRPLEVRVEREAAIVRIVVRDHGPGFPPDLLARAFEPFVKGDVARTPGVGSGLGLALVRRIVEAHGGRAFARNVTEVGRVVGAEVGIELPCTSTRAA